MQKIAEKTWKRVPFVAVEVVTVTVGSSASHGGGRVRNHLQDAIRSRWGLSTTAAVGSTTVVVDLPFREKDILENILQHEVPVTCHALEVPLGTVLASDRPI